MPKTYQFTAEQVAELTNAQKKNKNKIIDKRLEALLLRASGIKREAVSEKTGYSVTHISDMTAAYHKEGLSAIVENHYKANRRNMSVAEEAEFLSVYKKQSESGQLIEVSAIKKAYEDKVGHRIGGSQIYRVLKRHGFRKIMPRSKHPKSASPEAIEASKKN